VSTPDDRLAPGLRHEALFYAGADEFAERAASFVIDALGADEPVMVAVDGAKIDLLCEVLGSDADAVVFADMGELGSNPARIIPAWRRFVADRSVAGRPVRGMGEPIWPGRRTAEVVESQRHEELLNLVFHADPLWLLCPYDTAGLGPEVIAEARCSHPRVVDRSGGRASLEYRGAEAISAPATATLPEPPVGTVEVCFDRETLGSVRRHVVQAVDGSGLGAAERDDLALAAHEVAANSIEHGLGSGRLRVWRQDESVICEVRDGGQIRAPLAGWELPPPGASGGRGLWMANQLCDLVQIRSGIDGTTVRLHRHLVVDRVGEVPHRPASRLDD
jgi:anti-sigma regulatory factor (Ser/Thr protein kinase)